LGHLVLTMPKTCGDLKYVIWNMVKGLRSYDSSVKYYVYVMLLCILCCALVLFLDLEIIH